MCGKVGAEDVGIVADFAKVDALSAALKEEEAVKVFEEGRVRLMDRAKDSLAGGSKFAEEADNVEGGLRVETRSGLVEEEEEFGFGSELNTDYSSC